MEISYKGSYCNSVLIDQLYANFENPESIPTQADPLPCPSSIQSPWLHLKHCNETGHQLVEETNQENYRTLNIVVL